MRKRFFLFMALCLSALPGASQDRNVKRLGDVVTIFVQEEHKSDASFLNEAAAIPKDYQQRKQALEWVRALRRGVSERLAQVESPTASNESRTADALLTIIIPEIVVAAPSQATKPKMNPRTGRDPARVAVALTSHGRTLWTIEYGLKGDSDKTAGELYAKLLAAIRKDREKSGRNR